MNGFFCTPLYLLIILVTLYKSYLRMFELNYFKISILDSVYRHIWITKHKNLIFSKCSLTWVLKIKARYYFYQFYSRILMISFNHDVTYMDNSIVLIHAIKEKKFKNNFSKYQKFRIFFTLQTFMRSERYFLHIFFIELNFTIFVTIYVMLRDYVFLQTI